MQLLPGVQGAESGGHDGWAVIFIIRLSFYKE